MDIIKDFEDYEDFDNYIYLQTIGKGNGGNVVLRFKNLDDNKSYAVKKLLYNKNNKEEIKRNLNEIEIFQEMNHPYIIKYYNSLFKNEYLYIFMEYAEGGDLYSEIKKHIESKNYISEDIVKILCLYYNFKINI